MSWSLDFQSLILPTASHGLCLSFLLSLISKMKVLEEAPYCVLLRAWTLNMWNSGCRDPGNQQPLKPPPTSGEQLPEAA